MQKFILGLLLKFKTVDSILMKFHAAIQQLEAVAESQVAHAAEHEKVAEEALKVAKAAKDEASRAVDIAAKMKNVFQ